MKCNRREFLRTGGAAIACTCLGGLCLSSCSPFSSASNTPAAPGESYQIEEGRIVLDLDKAPGLASIGGSVKLEFLHPAEGVTTKIILIHRGDSAYLAFANRCTHNGKELEYDHSARMMRCVSRHSEFDMNGNVLKGKAKNSLTGYATERDGDRLIVKI